MPNNLAVLQKREKVSDWEALKVFHRVWFPETEVLFFQLASSAVKQLFSKLLLSKGPYKEACITKII